MRKLISTVLFIILSLSSFAADKKPDPQLTELQKKDLIIAFQTALLRQASLSQAQAQFQQSLQAYDELRTKFTKEAGFPEGTQLGVDSQKMEVVVTPPASVPKPDLPTPAAPAVPATTPKPKGKS